MMKMTEDLYIENLLKRIIEKLEDIKAKKIKVLEIKDRTSIADYMIITEGSSSRHVASIVNNISKEMKRNIISLEGITNSEWALIDFGDIILHVFKSEIRTLYNLEKIWSDKAPDEKKQFG